MSNELRLRLYEAEDELYGLKLTIASMGKDRDKQIRRIRELESENERLHDLAERLYELSGEGMMGLDDREFREIVDMANGFGIGVVE